MKAITEELFMRLSTERHYFSGRWPYMAKAIEYAESVEPFEALEIGANGLPLFAGSVAMGIEQPETGEPVDVLHDATKTPWPFEADSFDVVIALQVWEHLQGGQVEAFREVARVSRAAVLSFPLRWANSDPMHDGHDLDTIAQWTDYRRPDRYAIIGNPHRERLVALWRFR